MSATIKRRPPARRPAAKRKAQPPLARRLLARAPVSPELVAKVGAYSVLAIAGAGLLAAAAWAGVPGMLGGALSEGAGRAGLRVEQIDIIGLKRMDRETVYALALQDQQSRAIFSVDLAQVRQNLLRYGWVADARVSRRLPDTLVIAVTEREPAAVWQDNGQLTLIDANGVLLAPVDPVNVPDLPLVIGPGADRQEGAYTRLMAAAPALKRQVRAAAWVGNRRWDLTFRTGETLALPEEGAPAALQRFARLHEAEPLLGRGWKRFDLRDPSRLVARKPGPAEARALAEPAPAATGTPAPGGAPTSGEG
jgi:cell division protein FtsQ